MKIRAPYLILLVAIAWLRLMQPFELERPFSEEPQHGFVGPLVDGLYEPYDFERREHLPEEPSLAALRALGDWDLRFWYEQCLRGYAGHDEDAPVPAREDYLLEMVARGGEEWVAFLKGLELRRARNAARFDPDRPGPGRAADGRDLETLTAIRRLQGVSDPVVIDVLPRGPLTASPLALPELEVVLRNADPGGEAVRFTEGGDYRSGRQARWRVRITTRRGEVLPELAPPAGRGGGLFGRGRLALGESWATTLHTGDFVEPPPPGEYRLQVLYGDEATIADLPEEALARHVLVRSEEVELRVEPLVVALTRAERARLDALFDEVAAQEPIELLAGAPQLAPREDVPADADATYRMWAAGADALPTLFAVLEDPDATHLRRGWALALLYAITGRNDPWDFRGALGTHTRVRAARDFGAIVGPGSTEVTGGFVPAAQERLAAAWAPLREHVRVREID